MIIPTGIRTKQSQFRNRVPFLQIGFPGFQDL
jgi:hypothetical protein